MVVRVATLDAKLGVEGGAGRRVWLSEGKRYLPDQHARIFNADGLSLANLAALIWGSCSEVVLTAISTVNVLVANRGSMIGWSGFSLSGTSNPEYRSWLY